MPSVRQVRNWMVQSLRQPNNPDLVSVDPGEDDGEMVVKTRKTGGDRRDIGDVFVVSIEKLPTLTYYDPCQECCPFGCGTCQGHLLTSSATSPQADPSG